MVRRWLLIGYFPIHVPPPLIGRCACSSKSPAPRTPGAGTPKRVTLLNALNPYMNSWTVKVRPHHTPHSLAHWATPVMNRLCERLNVPQAP
jgi:hypothetical protein